MDEQARDEQTGAESLRQLAREAVQEFIRSEQQRKEPAHRQELTEERRRREQLEQRVNELVEENRRSRLMAEEIERNSAIRSELQRLGVQKVDLAFRAVREDIFRTEDGQLRARTTAGQEVAAKEYLTAFVSENPELLPARVSGGSGAGVGGRTSAGVDLDQIRPGMSKDDLTRVRREIARLAGVELREEGKG